MSDVETIYNEAMAAWRRGEIDDHDALLRVVEAGAEEDPRFTLALMDARFVFDARVRAACGDARRACGRVEDARDVIRVGDHELRFGY
jgi:hypothetical protein